MNARARLMLPSLVLLSFVFLVVQAAAGWKAEVHGGSGSGTYPKHTSATFTADDPPEGMSFLRWWFTHGPIEELDHRGNQIRETDNEIEVGRNTNSSVEFGAVFGKIGITFLSDIDPKTNTCGLLLPRSDEEPLKRYPIEIHVEIDNSGNDDIDMDQVFSNLVVNLSWFPATTSVGIWGHSEIATFWDNETDGSQLEKDGTIDSDLFERGEGDESKFTFTCWYQPVWTVDQLQGPSNPTGKTVLPSLGFRSELFVRSAREGSQPFYTEIQNATSDLLPVEVNSMDKFLSGSFDECAIDAFGGEDSFGLEFRNSSSGEAYRYDLISEAYIYDDPYESGAEGEDGYKEDSWLSQEEVAMGLAGSDSEGRLSQDVIFYREGGKLHYRTIFDGAGEIEVAILIDGEEIAAIQHTLVEDVEMGDLLDTIDEILSDEWGDDPIILAAKSAQLSGELSSEDYALLKSVGDEVASAKRANGRRNYKRRNATTKVTISIWDRLEKHFENGVRKATEVATIAVRTAALTGKGFVEGAWMGVKDDFLSLAELYDMIANPEETAKAFYEGFKALVALDLEGWKNVGKTLVSSFLSKGQEGAGEWVQPNAYDVAAYLGGFTCGYIAEQVAVTYLTAGILKAGNIGATIGKFIRDAAKNTIPLLNRADQIRTHAQQVKNSIFRRWSQKVDSPESTKELKRVMDELFNICDFASP